MSDISLMTIFFSEKWETRSSSKSNQADDSIEGLKRAQKA